MEEAPASQYVELRNGGYYVAGTSIELDVIVHQFQSGKSPEAILQSHSSIGSLAKVYGVITFILERPETIAAYLADQERLWEDLREKHLFPQTCYGASSALVSCSGNRREGSFSGRRESRPRYRPRSSAARSVT